ncbi:MAG TPA: redoxin domain-containing protein [Pyrinomonadaceae bacterium]|nr:redoxin domain-containing protein [Pyrinomonadaceae bacterium]
MKLFCALLLAFSLNALTAPDARAFAARGVSADGVNRRVSAVKSAQRKARSQRAARKSNASNRTSAALPVVAEIDGEGLKKLLQRGDQQTARPLLVNFWATWCTPCRVEFPELVRVESEYRGRGLEFALVSADDVSDIKTSVPKFLREMRATVFPAYLLNATDTQAAVSFIDPTWGGELPATFLFDRKGQLVYKHTGIIDGAELRQEINKVMSTED